MNAVDSSLEEIELEVLALHNAINVRATVERAKRIGELLLAAKARLPHGAYLPWLKKLGLNRKTAHDYIVIAKAPNVRQTGHLGIGAVLTLLRAGRRADRQEQADDLAESVLPTQERKIVTADSGEWGRLSWSVTGRPRLHRHRAVGAVRRSCEDAGSRLWKQDGGRLVAAPRWPQIGGVFIPTIANGWPARWQQELHPAPVRSHRAIIPSHDGFLP